MGEEGDERFEKLIGGIAEQFGVSRQAMTIRLSSLFA
jgi:hypothetical protein